ncbi:MAG: tetratricopeptide repeat protein [Candidatus Aminicenantes bacterium]|nr:tetratricopeptide repeat protein [Candidatus Aminicenantes bacterium]
MKKRSLGLGVIGLLITAALLGAFSQSGEDLFQKALRLERNEGKLMEAIELYNKVVAEKGNEGLSAQAQLRIGMCYEKLGEKNATQAQDAFQKVIDNYPSEFSVVKSARERLSVLRSAKSPVLKSDDEFRIRKVWEFPPVGRGNLGRVSPDGHFLSLSDIEGNLSVYQFSTKKRHLITKDFFQDKEKISTTQPEEIPIKGDFPVWSPDGNQITFNRKQSTELCIIGANLNEPRVLYETTDQKQIYPVDWSPDGKLIFAAIGEKYMAFQAVLISVEDGSIRVLKEYDSPPTSEPRRLGLFSPDGKYIAGDFHPEGFSQKRDISLLAVDGSSEISLIDHPDDDLTLGWSPDGKMLIFASDRSGTWDVWAAEVKNGKPQGEPSLIKGGIGAIWPLGLTKNNSFHYFLEDNLMDIFTADFDSKSGKIQFPPIKATDRFVGKNFFPEWSPDGKYLSYVSFRNSGYDRVASKAPLCIRSLETGDEREIIPELRYIWGPRWSPDGRSILIVGSAKKDQEGFFLVDVKTGGITSVIQFEPGDKISEPEWSLNGKQIFYTYKHPQKEYGQIIRYDLQGKEKKEICQSEFNPSYVTGRNSFFPHDLAISPDGEWLAFNKGWSPVLMIVSTSGGEPREIFRMKKKGEQIGTIAWMPKSQELIFASYQLPKRESYDLWRISSSGENLQKLETYKDSILWMSAHPDGEQIVFGSNHKIKDVWLMENFLPKTKDKK